jgi:hypothetical protein
MCRMTCVFRGHFGIFMIYITGFRLDYCTLGPMCRMTCVFRGYFGIFMI